MNPFNIEEALVGSKSNTNPKALLVAVFPELVPFTAVNVLIVVLAIVIPVGFVQLLNAGAVFVKVAV